ncbi:MAG: caspase family protein [Gemmatimonadaceae bacterium]
MAPSSSQDMSFAGRMIVRAASVVLLAGAALAAQVPSRFTLGDLRERVRQIQGTPTVIERLYSLGVEHWVYDGASVTFDPATGRVVEWNDPQRTLRTTLRGEHHTQESTVTLGSDLGDVARLVGTPWAVTRDADRRHLYLAYGRSVIRVDAATERVNGWIRRDSALRVAAVDDSAAHAALAARPSAAASRRPQLNAPVRTRVSLALSGVEIRDASGDGRLAPREFADITLRIRNDGGTATPALPAHLVRSSGLVTIAGAPDTIWLSSIAAGDSTEVVVTAYVTGVAPAPELALLIWHEGAPIRLSTRIPTTPKVPERLPASADSARRAADDPATSAPAALARNGDALAVIVGIEDYQRLTDARFAHRDAALMRTYAVQTLGVPDDAAHLAYRAGAAASGTELRRLFGERGWLARRATDNADIFVYFAGHGAVDAAQRVPHLLPADADANYVGETGIDLHALFDRLARLPARSITVVLDACFSGLARSGQPLVSGTRAAVVSIEHPALVRRNMAVFVAARDAQLAGDLPEAQHGAFTWFVARGLRGDADTDHDRVITVAELGRFIETNVARASAALDREQQPLTIARDSLRAVARLAPRP